MLNRNRKRLSGEVFSSAQKQPKQNASNQNREENGSTTLRNTREKPLLAGHDKQNKGLFLTGQSWRVLKSGYTAGSPEQGFRRCFADGVNQSLISSARRLDFRGNYRTVSETFSNEIYIFRRFTQDINKSLF